MDNEAIFTNHVNAVLEKVEKRNSILKRLVGAKYGSSQTTPNKIYNVYIKPIFKYGSEIIVSITQEKINVLEKTQNKPLWIITKAVETTTITAMKIYFSNPTIAMENKKKAVGKYI